MTITRHAIDRYIERVRPVSPRVAEIILECERLQLAVQLHASSVPIPGGGTAIIENGTIVTVLSDSMARTRR